MADIKEEMSKIEKAYKGKEIKEAILSALDKVNASEGTARFLDGHGDSEFLTQEELEQFTPLDDTPTQGSGKGIASGKIFTYLDKMAKAVDDVNGVESSSGSIEPLKDKLEYLNETKRAIRKELIDKGIPVDPYRDTFRSYAEKIGLITMEANLDVQPLEITTNGTYEADEGTAYNPVTTNVAFNLTSKAITKNGIYKAESEGLDGYSEVDVSASDALMIKTISDDDFPKEMEPIELKASDEGEDIIGYSEITIDLTEKVMEKDPVILDPEETGEEYVYDAKDDDAYGYSKFTVSIKDTSTTFTVKFMSDGDVVYEDDNVPKGGYCSYKGPTLTKEGYVFSGWNPQPINVERNLICIAKWVEDEKAQKDAGGSSGGGQTIDKMNWADVLAHPNYIKEGDSKYIYWMPFEWNGFEFMGGKALATCIMKGEKGTNSTWYIPINMGNYINNIDKEIPDLYVEVPQGEGGVTANVGYEKHPLYGLCAALAGAIQSCNGEGYEGQSNLNFASVEKTTLSVQGGSHRNVIKTLSGIWLFSMYELMANAVGKHVGEGNKDGSVYYDSFSFNLGNCPPSRSLSDFYENKISSDAASQVAGRPLNTIMAQYTGFFGIPHSIRNQGQSQYGYGWSLGYLDGGGKNQAYYDSVYSVGTYRTVCNVDELGRGDPISDYGTIYFGFCL